MQLTAVSNAGSLEVDSSYFFIMPTASSIETVPREVFKNIIKLQMLMFKAPAAGREMLRSMAGLHGCLGANRPARLDLRLPVRPLLTGGKIAVSKFPLHTEA